MEFLFCFCPVTLPSDRSCYRFSIVIVRFAPEWIVEGNVIVGGDARMHRFPILSTHVTNYYARTDSVSLTTNYPPQTLCAAYWRSNTPKGPRHVVLVRLNYTSKRFGEFSRGNLFEHFAILKCTARCTVGYVLTGYMPARRLDGTILSRSGAVISNCLTTLLNRRLWVNTLGYFTRSRDNGITSSDWWHK